MNTICIKSDIKASHFSYDGNVICHGMFEIENDVAITGNLIVMKDISIGGDCGVEELTCKGSLNIGGYLFCSKFNCSSDIKIGYAV